MRFPPILSIGVISLFIGTHLHAATVDISPVGRKVEVQSPGEIFNWSVKVSDLQQSQTAFWQVIGWNGEELSQLAPLALNNGEGKIQYKPTKVGWQELVVGLKDAKGNVLEEKKRGFVSGQTRKQKPEDFKYGIASHVMRSLRKSNELFQADLDLVDKLGVAYMRDGTEWGGLQPKPDEWKWDSFDLLLSELEKRNIQLETLLGFTVKWASTAPNEKGEKPLRVVPQMDAWVNYVKQFVGRYKGRIKYWEIWNEPDIGFWQSPTEDFLKLFSITAQTIREVYPDAVIMNGGFACVQREPNRNFLEEFCAKADRRNWDVFAYHDYHTFENLLTRRNQMNVICEKNKIKIPVWMNEGGLTATGVGERIQAIVLAKKLATAPSLDMEAYIVYDLKNDGVNPNEPEHNFGLVWNDYAAKPSFATYQTFLNLAGGRKFIRTVPSSSSNIWAHVFGERSDDKTQMLFIWSEGNLGTELVWIDQLKDAQIFDVMGNALPNQSSGAGILVPIGDVPIYIQGKPLKSEWNVKSVLNSPSSIILNAGGETSASLSFTNPFPRAVQVSVETTDLSKGIRSFRNAPVEIKPSASSNIPLVFECSTDLDPKPMVKLKFTMDDSSSEIQLPIVLAQLLPLVSKTPDQIELSSSEGKSYDLTSAKSIVNFFSAEPFEENHWHGPSDLSATARFAYTKEALCVTVQATDDIHSQKFEGDAIWKGDSLQLSVQVNPQQSAHLQIALALLDSQKTSGWVYQVPAKSSLSSGSLKGDLLPFAVHRENNTTTYAVQIPWKALGISEPPRSGLRMSFLVNDNDGKERKQWVQFSEGIGKMKNPDFFPWFSFGK